MNMIMYEVVIAVDSHYEICEHEIECLLRYLFRLKGMIWLHSKLCSITHVANQSACGIIEFRSVNMDV